MKRLIFVIAALALTGCIGPARYVYAWEAEAAIKLCANHGGLLWFEASDRGPGPATSSAASLITAHCNSGLTLVLLHRKGVN
jgi:hypothetical protein